MIRQAFAVGGLLLVEEVEQPGEIVRLQIADGWGAAALGRLDLGEGIRSIPLFVGKSHRRPGLHLAARRSAPGGSHHLAVEARCLFLCERHRVEF